MQGDHHVTAVQYCTVNPICEDFQSLYCTVLAESVARQVISESAQQMATEIRSQQVQQGQVVDKPGDSYSET